MLAEGSSTSIQRFAWAALSVNGIMFDVEAVVGLISGSVALQADALDLRAGWNLGIKIRDERELSTNPVADKKRRGKQRISTPGNTHHAFSH